MLLRTVVLSLGLAAAVANAASPDEQAVLDAERIWSRGLVASDVKTLERVMGDDLTYGHASGNTDTKRTYIDRIGSGAQKYTSFRYDPGMTVRVYGNTALLNATAQVESVTDGTPNSPHLRFLHVFVKRNGQWELVAHQSTKSPTYRITSSYLPPPVGGGR